MMSILAVMPSCSEESHTERALYGGGSACASSSSAGFRPRRFRGWSTRACTISRPSTVNALSSNSPCDHSRYINRSQYKTSLIIRAGTRSGGAVGSAMRPSVLGRSDGGGSGAGACLGGCEVMWEKPESAQRRPRPDTAIERDQRAACQRSAADPSHDRAIAWCGGRCPPPFRTQMIRPGTIRFRAVLISRATSKRWEPMSRRVLR